MSHGQYYGLRLGTAEDVDLSHLRHTAHMQAIGFNISLAPKSGTEIELNRDVAFLEALGHDIVLFPKLAPAELLFRHTALMNAVGANIGITPMSADTLSVNRHVAALNAAANPIKFDALGPEITNVSRHAATMNAQASNIGISPQAPGTTSVNRHIASCQAVGWNIGISPNAPTVTNISRHVAGLDAAGWNITITPQSPPILSQDRKVSLLEARGLQIGFTLISTPGTTAALFPPGVGAYMWRDVSGGWKVGQSEGAVVAFIKGSDFVRQTDTLGFVLAASNAAGTRLELGIQEVGPSVYEIYFEWDSAETGAGTAGTVTGFALDDSQWHCIVWQKEGSTYRVYVDGVSRSVSGNAPVWFGDIQQSVTFNRLAIGTTLSNGDTPPGDFYEGSLDEIFTVTRPLTSTEVFQITNRLGAGPVKGMLIPQVQSQLPLVWADVDYAFELQVGGGRNFGDEYVQNQATPGSGDNWMTVAPLSDSIQPDPSGIEGT